MSAPPRVSVITPVFNAGAYLQQALDSVAAQTYRDLEVVLVDDGSTDARTRTILDAAASRPGVTVHRTANRGPSHARNLAIESARGAYILPLDADDWLAPTFLTRTVAVLDGDPAAGVVYTWVGLTGDHHGVWKTGGFTVPELLSRCTIHVSSLFRRRLWEDVGGYDPRYIYSCEDWDLWLGAAGRGWEGRGIPEVLAYYRRTPTGREQTARRPAESEAMMRCLVSKHRHLYEAHLEDAFAGMYARLGTAGLMLERIYNNPAMRAVVKVRGLVKRWSSA